MADSVDVTTQTRKKLLTHPRDPAREIVETIVFVVVLVLLLKLFVTEAFVIPTGSMAETLYGYQKQIICPKCGHTFPVNSHDEVEGNQQSGRKTPLYGYTCPNCRYQGQVKELKPEPQNRTGDRVLVLKPLYHLRDPEPGDVVVFKYPERPQERHTAQNYIKRAMGFGGETLAIHQGNLYVTKSLTYPEGDPLYSRPEKPEDLWMPRYMYSNVHDSNPKALELFEASRAAGFAPGQGGFEIRRKGEDQLLASLRLVWDNDQQPKDLAGKVPTRWYAPPESNEFWRGDDQFQPKAFAHTGSDLNWIRYRHLAMPWKALPPDQIDSTPQTDMQSLAKQEPMPIDNFLGYNTGRDFDPATGRATARDNTGLDRHWVGDLAIETEAEVPAGGEVVLELSRGVNRFQAIFGEGKVTLARIGRGTPEFGNPSRPCNVTAGRYKLRFANIDSRLWVWVDDKLIDFGAEGDYLPTVPLPSDRADPEGWTKANDIDAPASIGARGAVTVRNIKLHRDIFYTRSTPDPTSADVFYVQPGHYLCLGDNSAQSSDSRKWGTVPDRLMLGKAVFVFFPVGRMGFIK